MPAPENAAFSRNILARVNRELGAHFDLRAFRHQARFNEEQSRIEIHLESTRPQTISIDRLNLQVEFAAGELIHAENSYKYDLDAIAGLASQSGFNCERTWLDQQRQFSSNLLRAV